MTAYLDEIGDQVHIVRMQLVDEGDGGACANASGASDAVDVSDDLVWQVVVDHLKSIMIGPINLYSRCPDP